WVLTGGSTAPALEELVKGERWRRRLLVGWLDSWPPADCSLEIEFTLNDIVRYPSDPPASRNESTDPAHILFTSGSTGTPKGVVVKLEDFPSLKRVIWAGEVLPTPTLIYWMTHLPRVQFTNLYGPTETTIASSYYTVPTCPANPQAAIPIGSACTGERLRVLDSALRPVGPEETGELYISGVGLAQGYWRDADRTNASFPRDPESPSEG